MNSYNTMSLLVDKISVIKNDLVNLNSIFDELNSVINEAILIDDKVPLYDEMSNLKKSTEDMINQISNEIIPMISNKI